jgi:hypothetical protein
MSINEQHDPFSTLNLPQAVHVQALKLLGSIALTRTANDCRCAADRAEGFVLGVETV